MRASPSVGSDHHSQWPDANTFVPAGWRRTLVRTGGGALAAAAVALGACSSSSTSVTSPTSTRCPVQLSQTPSTIGAAGGSGQIAIAVNRECTWEARSETDWITLAAPTSGQGEGNLGYSVAANPAVSVRRGAVVVNEQRIDVAQSAAECRYSLSSAGGSAAPSGGSIAVSVSAQPTCPWTAASQADWIRIDAGREGNGPGAVTIGVAPNPGPAREGSVIIAGQAFSVSQPAVGPVPQPGCDFTVAPDAESFVAAGGEGNVRVIAAGPACAWAASSNVPWVTLTAGGGSGSGSLRYIVGANTGAARTGFLTVATSVVTINQAAAAATPGCQVSVSPQSESFQATGGNGSVQVTASGSNCGWNAASSVQWITVGTAAGNGSGNVQYSVAANTGAARTGTLSVAGVTVTVSQSAAAAPACEFDVSPQSESFAANGGNDSVRVRTGSNCSWTASSTASWIVVTAGGATGDGDARYTVAANTGAARSGSLRVAGVTVTVTQAAPPACQYDVSPTSESFSANGGDGRVRIRADHDCPWVAVPSASWISLREGSGSGNGNAQYRVAANTGAARTGTLTVGGTVVTINQEAARPSSTRLDGEIDGLSGECPNVTFNLDRRLVRTNSSTQFDERCDHLRNRRDVTVWGTPQNDNSVLAQRVERDR